MGTGIRNFFCDRCLDSGKVLFGFRKCPECNGDPEGTWRRNNPPPKIAPSPQNCTGVTAKELQENVRKHGVMHVWGNDIHVTNINGKAL